MSLDQEKIKDQMNGLFKELGLEPINDCLFSVQTADEVFLLKIGRNIGLKKDTNFCVDSEQKGLIGKKRELLFAFDSAHNLLHHLEWSDDHRDPNRDLWKFAKQIFLKCDESLLPERKGEQPIHDAVEYLVWVTIEWWHNYTGIYDQPFGVFQERVVRLTVYEKPACGFRKLNEKVDFYEHLTFNQALLIKGQANLDFRILILTGRLQELCRLFQDEVYLNGMKQVMEGKTQDCRRTVDGIDFFASFLNDVHVVRLAHENTMIGMILRPDQEMYSSNCWGTLPDIRRLVMTIVKLWSVVAGDFRANFKPDWQPERKDF